MNQSCSISIVNRSILRDHIPFKDETPEVFKMLTNTKTYTDASTMNESFQSVGHMSRTTTNKYSTLNMTRNQFVPEVKKKEFLNPYFFVSFLYFTNLAETTKVRRWKSANLKLQ